MVDDYDSPWKEAIEQMFADFLLFFFPAAHAQIDWSQELVFLDQEFRPVSKHADIGLRYVDKLVRVVLHNGQAEYVYVHLEVQSQSQERFAERMFIYNFRIFEHYHAPVASLALLTDERASWRPDEFSYGALGCRTGIRFPVAKLLDWVGSEAMLEDSANPFAVITLAHLATRATNKDPLARKDAKVQAVRGLQRHGWDAKRRRTLFDVVDWMMCLPKELDQQVWREVQSLEKEDEMPYVSSLERMAIEEGLKQGLEQGLQQGLQQGRRAGEAHVLARLIARRFGELPNWAQARLSRATAVELDAWTEALLSVDSIEALFGEFRQ